MIKFIGKRIPGAHTTPAHTPATPAVTATPATSGSKSLSVGATVEHADFPAKRWSRLTISVEEMNVINQGTNEVGDWSKIKL